jgi:uncharacterized protein (DUF342 family)
MKGELNLEIDELGLEVRVTITPGDKGGEVTPESLHAVLAEKKVRAGIDSEAIDRAFRTLLRKKTEPVTFVAAAGTPPQPGTPESVLFESLPVPPRLGAVARKVLEKAPPPRGYRIHEEKIKTEKTVIKKSALRFLPGRQEVETVVEKKEVREDVAIDETVVDTGFVTRGTLVARIRPGKQGKEGKSVFGRLVPASRPEQGAFLFCAGLTRAGADVEADVTGFLRKGANWCDVVAFRDHSIELAPAPDRLTCMLTFIPGDPAAPAPDTEELLARAQKMGFSASSLMTGPEIEAMIGQAIEKQIPLEKRPITPTVNGLALVTVSPDKLKAVLYLRKGRGGGTPLSPAAATDAIRAAKVKVNLDAVRKDLRAFFDGPTTELADYVLATGRPPKQGSEPKIEWRALFLPAEESEKVRAQARANPAALKGIESLAAFPVEKVEAVARAKKDGEVLKISPSVGSEPGTDVFGAAIPLPKGGGPDLRLFEGLVQKRDIVVMTAEGVLEKGSDGMAILLRVRPHKDGELRVVLTPDRMKATVTFIPPEGDGARIMAEEVRSRLAQAQVRKGINEEKLLALLDGIGRGETQADVLIAEGKKPGLDAKKRIVFHAHIATGRAVTLREDGRADFRAQDRISRVRKGELVATVRPRDPESEDGWDVTGMVIPLPPEAQETLQAGRGVRDEVQPDGSVRFVSEAAGEIILDGATLSVMDVHTVNGDADMSTGNVNFPGNVRITGSVRSGFTIVAGGILEVGESVEAALLSAAGSITVVQGIKGEGRAILRARHDIVSLFAEQAVLLAIGDVHLRGACVRCQVKCNGRLLLDSEKGSLIGGEVRATRGVAVQNIGSPGGVRTVVSFGQDFLVKDQIEREDKEVAALTKKSADLDVVMHQLQKKIAASGAPTRAGGAQSQDAAALAKARAEKVSIMKLMEQRKLRLIGLHDKYDEHIPSEILVRGTLFPGAVIESHGRHYEFTTEKKMITLHFDATQGRIVEKL